MKRTDSHLALIRVDGADARDFLHRQLSADINALSPNDATFACLCQPRGRVIATLLVIAGPGRMWLRCATTLAEKVVNWLQRFVFRDDVRFEVVKNTADSPAPPIVEPLPGLVYHDPAKPVRRSHELSLGLAWLGPESSEAFLPQMLGADTIGALSYRKGCYPGQEIVARTHYLGKLKQRPVLARVSSQIDMPSMTAATLHGETSEISAQIVDSATESGETQLFLVARSQVPADVREMSWEGGRVELALAHWPEPATTGPNGDNAGAQASATT